MKYQYVMVMRVNPETGEVAYRRYYNCSEKQALAWFNARKFMEGFNEASVYAVFLGGE